MSMSMFIYDGNGVPVEVFDVDRYDRFMALNRCVARSYPKSNITLLTSFVGNALAPPIGDETGKIFAFETMIFGGEFDGYCHRYCCLTDAKEGHEIIAGQLRDGSYCQESNAIISALDVSRRRQIRRID